MSDDREFFDGFGIPSPPEGLRLRVLAEVGPVLAREPRGRWTRIWESRPLRIAWAAAVVLLAGGHLALSFKPGRRAAPSASTSAELARATALPRVDPQSENWTELEDEEWIERAERPRHAVPPAARKEKTS